MFDSPGLSDPISIPNGKDNFISPNLNVISIKVTQFTDDISKIIILYKLTQFSIYLNRRKPGGKIGNIFPAVLSSHVHGNEHGT
jgi:hypothetical protein